MGTPDAPDEPPWMPMPHPDPNHWSRQGTMHNHRPMPWDDNPYQDLPHHLCPAWRGAWLFGMARFSSAGDSRMLKFLLRVT